MKVNSPYLLPEMAPPGRHIPPNQATNF